MLPNSRIIFFLLSLSLFLKKDFIELLIYNVVLISAVQQSDSFLSLSLCIYIYIFHFFPIMVYHKILNVILCATQ